MVGSPTYSLTVASTLYERDSKALGDEPAGVWPSRWEWNVHTSGDGIHATAQ
jgi:hypothetical protein